ncbi:MAG: response regulator [Bacteroidetes bacterium]|nr:response regulator [Bacteroidota bacterium]
MYTQRILLHGEDDDGHALLLRINLKEVGVNNEIIRLKDGEEVIDYITKNSLVEKKKKFMLLMDINMPRLNGKEVLKKLKKHPRHRNIPVIIISTCNDPDIIDECYHCGCEKYFTKPVNYEHLKRTIETEMYTGIRNNKIHI